MLPPEFKKYFWDVDFETLDLVKRWKFILSRLMEIGGLDAARWIRRNISSDKVRWILKHVRDISLRNATFWGLVYGVPTREIKCFHQPYRNQRRRVWPY
ncbi:MAG: hypothetical protein UW51_C0005G0082 [Candidatus Amesbacteria bacterium GW2011_GWA1_44_24]|nr:MAG: hypothetical protein UW51_C0005G0082 [Candidatus Amesbacteria bacterium GW2011_GWA1_44_24]KKU30654.1 MAG: hypothetical protein UX46_C0016G0008 [Candidatus Amesbacteria bacterium GW2011_GWC1_46_24]